MGRYVPLELIIQTAGEREGTPHIFCGLTQYGTSNTLLTTTCGILLLLLKR